MLNELYYNAKAVGQK